MSSILYSSEANDSQTDVYGSNWYGQSFTTGSRVVIDEVELYLNKIGSPAGNATVEIRATSSGLPTGSSLTTTSITASTVGVSEAWVSFSFSSPLSLSSNTQYAIVFSVPSGANASNCIQWNRSSTDVFAGGQRVNSTNSGSSWTASSTIDFDFRVYGRLPSGGNPIFFQPSSIAIG